MTTQGTAKRWVWLAAALGAALVTSSLDGSQEPRLQGLTRATFAAPPATARPWVRWNLPPGVTMDGLQRDLRDIAAAGISGVELGQGTFPTQEQLSGILTMANELGLSIGLSHGAVSAPPGFSQDDPNARKTLVAGRLVIRAGERMSGTVPPPVVVSQPGRGGARGAANANSAAPPPARTLLAVLAYRCATPTCPTTGVVTLDAASVVNLTSSVSNSNGADGGRLTWAPPDAGAPAEWTVVSLWTQGAMAQPDLLSREGTRLLIDGMERTLFTPAIRALAARNGADLFYDSHSGDRGSPADLWTTRMAEEFEARRGYALIPVLPAVLETQFDLGGGVSERVRNDFYQLRTDLWEELHLKPLRQWAHGLGLKLRVQPYGENIPSVDAIQGAAAVDRPETESLWFGDEVDNYLPIASAAHVLGNPWYSTECCAVVNASYAQDFQDTLSRMHKSFAGGITKLVYHVYPYRDAANATWPGYHNFNQGFSNAWGPREPYWLDARAYNDYLARTQAVLVEGTARVDVAVYMQNYVFPQPYNNGGLRHWRDTSLQEAGYTRDYLNPTLLRLPRAVVKAGRLVPDGPAYKALILDSRQLPPMPPVRTAMPADVAEKVLALARAGLPIVIVGDAPNRVPGRGAADDERVSRAMAALVQLPGVKRVAEERDAPAALTALGVQPSARPANTSPVLTVHRRSADADYYFFYNQGQVTTPFQTLIDPAPGMPVDVTFALEGAGRPYRLDAWTGEVQPLAAYTTGAGRVSVRLHLAAEDAAIVAVTSNAARFGPARAAAVGLSDADVVYNSAGAIVVRVTGSATTSVPLRNGQVTSVRAGDVPAAIDLTNQSWHVSAEDWRPERPYGETGPDAARTRKDKLELDLPRLLPWPDVPLLQDVSGVATYTTVFTLPSTWGGSLGARLELGEVFDSFTVQLNGQSLPPVNQLSAEADVTRYLRPGRNELVVRVATTLRNRLRTLDQTQGARPRQPYGLIGPVRLQPYREMPIGNAAQ